MYFHSARRVGRLEGHLRRAYISVDFKYVLFRVRPLDASCSSLVPFGWFVRIPHQSRHRTWVVGRELRQAQRQAFAVRLEFWLDCDSIRPPLCVESSAIAQIPSSRATLDFRGFVASSALKVSSCIEIMRETCRLSRRRSRVRAPSLAPLIFKTWHLNPDLKIVSLAQPVVTATVLD